jgi:hypothetical protein
MFAIDWQPFISQTAHELQLKSLDILPGSEADTWVVVYSQSRRTDPSPRESRTIQEDSGPAARMAGHDFELSDWLLTIHFAATKPQI